MTPALKSSPRRADKGGMTTTRKHRLVGRFIHCRFYRPKDGRGGWAGTYGGIVRSVKLRGGKPVSCTIQLIGGGKPGAKSLSARCKGKKVALTESEFKNQARIVWRGQNIPTHEFPA